VRRRVQSEPLESSRVSSLIRRTCRAGISCREAPGSHLKIELEEQVTQDDRSHRDGQDHWQGNLLPIVDRPENQSSMARRINNLHRRFAEERPKDLGLCRARRNPRLHGIREPSHPAFGHNSSAGSCADPEQRCPDRSARRPEYDGGFRRQFGRRRLANSDITNSNLASSNLGAESGVWQRARFEAHSLSPAADLRRRH